ncbi:MAG: anthranilate synthase component II [Syntrophomonadaceae bacterium]|mgnify:CR=1 FL=1|jgi:anthranilate synthase component 2|nr:aminodeoxychorismate/anthranilate synthase component II [Bacillota bacterium]MDI9479560.1 aminodeoxychorismate/anthranilate synthase component II [Bacillota bacterium]
MILLVDNYDSFSYNLVQLAGSINPDIRVVRNDAMPVEAIEALHPSHIIISPGPGYPEDAGVCIELIRCLAGKIPILGVCLGFQAICAAYGGEITYARQLMHGKKSSISLDSTCPIFRGLPDTIEAARYHSLAAREDTLPERLRVIAKDSGGEIMGVERQDYDVYGVQFHPESILTPLGNVIMKNFLKL